MAVPNDGPGEAPRWQIDEGLGGGAPMRWGFDF